jgi:hypothetical protein
MLIRYLGSLRHALQFFKKPEPRGVLQALSGDKVSRFCSTAGHGMYISFCFCFFEFYLYYCVYQLFIDFIAALAFHYTKNVTMYVFLHLLMGIWVVFSFLLL